MDVLRAKEILSVLAEGVNPITGEVLVTHDSCNQVEVVLPYIRQLVFWKR